MQKTENAHRGSTLDSFLHEEGIYHQVTTAAVLEVFVEEAREEMERQNVPNHGLPGKWEPVAPS